MRLFSKCISSTVMPRQIMGWPALFGMGDPRHARDDTLPGLLHV